MNPWISFSQLCEQGLILPSSASAVNLIYRGIQSSEVGHPHQMVATFYNLCISLDTRLPIWLYGVKLTESAQNHNLSPSVCYREFKYACTYKYPCAAHRSKQGELLMLHPLPQKCFLLHCIHPLPTSTASSLKPTCPHIPVLLSATREATCFQTSASHRGCCLQQKPNQTKNQSKYPWVTAGAADSWKKCFKEAEVQGPHHLTTIHFLTANSKSQKGTR